MFYVVLAESYNQLARVANSFGMTFSCHGDPRIDQMPKIDARKLTHYQLVLILARQSAN